MIRTQIQISERQSRQLKAAARKQGASVAEIIRRSIDSALASDLVTDPEEIRERALQVVGKYVDTVQDVSEKHDLYLAEAYEA